MSTRSNVLDEVARIALLPYTRQLIPNGDGTWFAAIAEFPGCMTEGDTTAEALENLEDAMRGWLSVMVEDGNPIPPPKLRT